MLLTDVGEEHFFKVFVEVSVIITDSHKAALDDVGHNHFIFCSTFYPYSREKGEMLHGK